MKRKEARQPPIGDVIEYMSRMINQKYVQAEVILKVEDLERILNHILALERIRYALICRCNGS